MSSTVLFVDDDPKLLSAMKRVFRNEPYEIYTTTEPEKGLHHLRVIQTDVIVVDQYMPSMNGIDFLKVAQKIAPESLRLMLTGNADLSLALQAINEGEIYRFFTKPYNEIEFGIALRQAIQQKKLFGHNKRALELIRMQSSYIEHLEEAHPGITDVERDEGGRIVLSSSVQEIDKVVADIEAELYALDPKHMNIVVGDTNE